MKAAIPWIFLTLFLTTILTAGCTGARLSHEEARRQIADIGGSTLTPQAVEVRRIVSQSGDRAIAETTVAMTFEFQRDAATDSWRIAAVRLGDRDWIDMNQLMTAVEEVRQAETARVIALLAAGIERYRQQQQALPAATDIVGLTDLLHPNYIDELIRADGWGNPIGYEIVGGRFRLSSPGLDGVAGTADDVTLER